MDKLIDGGLLELSNRRVKKVMSLAESSQLGHQPLCCVFCDNALETMAHLLMECDYNVEV
ncbi:hypothetical protein LINPERHAP1_LOCUS32429 [Linum perenne]